MNPNGTFPLVLERPACLPPSSLYNLTEDHPRIAPEAGHGSSPDQDESIKAFKSELCWREFYLYILYHFPHVEFGSFKKDLDAILWKNDSEDFKRWKLGTTRYPIVDAAMHQINA